MATDNPKLEAVKTSVGALNDLHPILLFPVRLEVRFMTIKHVAKVPPTGVADISVVDHNAYAPYFTRIATTLNEVTNPLRGLLLPGIPVAFGDPDYVKATLKPVADTHELWVRIYPDEVAIANHESGLTEDEREQGRFFWQSIAETEHLNEENTGAASLEELETLRKNLKLGAWKALINSYGVARSAWIIEATNPDLEEEASITPFTWNDQARSTVMPDQFVFIGYRGGTPVKEVVGNPILQDPLPVGIDPQNLENEGSENAFQETGEGLSMPDNIKWMTDFQEAVKHGMGIRVPLENADFSSGFEKLIVVGVQSGKDATSGQETINRLFLDHLYSEGTLSIIPNGTPTNNTEEGRSGLSLDELDPELSFQLFVEEAGFQITDNHQTKTDGQRMAEALGIPVSFFQKVFCGDGQDISQAIWMNKVLSPATTDYALRQFLYPKLTEEQIRLAVKFSDDHVLGRGLLPALRIDEQPYAVIPTTCFSSLDLPDDTPVAALATQLHNRVLKQLDEEWNLLKAKVVAINKSLDNDEAGKILFRILEQHATSVDFFQRLSIDKQTIEVLKEISTSSNVDVVLNKSVEDLIDELEKFGFSNTTTAGSFPDSKLLGFGIFQSDRFADLLGPIIEDAPLSEERKLQIIEDNDANYLSWLGDVQTTLTNIRQEEAFLGGHPPRALLYILLRHALLRKYLVTAIDIQFETSPLAPILKMDFPLNMIWVPPGIEVDPDTPLSEEDLDKFRQQENFQFIFLHLVTKALGAGATEEEKARFANDFIQQNREIFITNDRWRILTDNERDGMSLDAYLDQALQNAEPSVAIDLSLHKDYLRNLSQLSTSALERLFAEHLDTCHYRLDAWLSGLVSMQLQNLRASVDSPGTYYGAFGYLENVQRQDNSGLFVEILESPSPPPTGTEGIIVGLDFTSIHPEPHSLESIFEKSFVYLGEKRGAPISNYFGQFDFDQNLGKIITFPITQEKGGGFIPSPSIAHAAAAAVLRNGYDSYQKNNEADAAFAVDLNSARVREALFSSKA